MIQDPPSHQGTVVAAIEAIRKEIRPLVAPSQVTIFAPEQSEQLLRLSALLGKAEALIEQAHNEGLQIREQARIEGHRAGLSETGEALIKARGEYTALMTRAEGDMVSLALEMTRKIVGHRLEVEPELLGNLIARTLELARGRQHIEIHVHPEDLPRTKTMLPRLQDITGTVQIYAVEDEQVPKRGCRIETEAGIIEADLETQLEVLAEALGVAPWSQRKDQRHG